MSGRRGPAARGGGGGGSGNWRRSGSAKAKEQRLRLGAEELLESRLGFAPYTDGERRLGWLLTFSPESSISRPLWSLRCSCFGLSLNCGSPGKLRADLRDAVIRVGIELEYVRNGGLKSSINMQVSKKAFTFCFG